MISRWSIAAVILGLLAIAVFGSRHIVKSSGMSTVQTDRSPLALPLERPRIVVRKAARRLDLYSGDKLLRTYKAGLGFSPIADKKQEGDGATPEGEFYVFVKNNKSAYYLSLGISYPNAEDADRGLRDGLINRAQYRAITEAIRNKTAPPQYPKLGGLIY